MVELCWSLKVFPKLFLGIYIQGSRPSHPFKVIEPESTNSSQPIPADNPDLQNRVGSNTLPIDRRSISGSICSERTTSSSDFTFRPPNTNASGRGLVGSESRSSAERNTGRASTSQTLCLESFITPQVK